jgi:hypothetical protein
LIGRLRGQRPAAARTKAFALAAHNRLFPAIALPSGAGQEVHARAVTRAQVDAVTGNTPIMRPLFAPGDGLLFDERFLHRTGIDPGMRGERRAIETWFFAPSSFPSAYIPIAL